MVKEVKSSSIVVTFKIKFKSTGTVGQSIEGIIENGKRFDKNCKVDTRGKEQRIINPTTGIIKCQTTEEIIKNGKRYDKECKINSIFRHNDVRGK